MAGHSPVFFFFFSDSLNWGILRVERWPIFPGQSKFMPVDLE